MTIKKSIFHGVGSTTNSPQHSGIAAAVNDDENDDGSHNDVIDDYTSLNVVALHHVAADDDYI
jgi:hypothetical protein